MAGLFFAPVFEFVNTALSKGASVLIHCMAGAHRAGTTACAFVMHKHVGMTARDAIGCCKARRPVVDPGISVRLMQVLKQLQLEHQDTQPGTGSIWPASTTTESGHSTPAQQPVDLDLEGKALLLGGAAAEQMNDIPL